MRFLLDTNVISEMRRPRPSRTVTNWYAGLRSPNVFLSVISLGEIHRGILKAKETAPARVGQLEVWLNRLENDYADAILPVDVRVSKRWAELRHRRSNGDVEDLLIAATASVHSLTVATRNVRDFQDLGVALFNPFEPGDTP